MISKKRSTKGRRQQALEEEMWQKANVIERSEDEDSNEQTSPSATVAFGRAPGIKTFADKKGHSPIFPKAKSMSEGASAFFQDDDELEIPHGVVTTGTPYWQDTAVSLYAQGEYYPGKTGKVFAKSSSFSQSLST